MDEEQRLADIEVLARMTARLAGRDPDQHVQIDMGGALGFEGPMWRYPDFLERAKRAYAMLV